VLPNISDPVSNYYKKNKGRGIFLDIGCGSGLTANFWGSKGSIFYYKKFAKVAGVEISNKARKFLSDRHVQSWSHIKDIPCDLRFGVIRMNWSLEHVHAPSEYFQFIRDRLEDGGVAVICVPNYEGLIYRLAKDCLELPVHLYHFTPDALVKYGEKYGLKILKIKTFSYPAMFSVASEYGLLPKNIFNNINISDAKKYQNFLNEIDLANMGNDIIAIFEKYQ
jgi:SAM-dependent methyltransferase